MFICAGSQGDYRSALSRIVKGEHKEISLSKGDNIIFSSKIIPGNEDKIEQMQEKLRDAGVEVISTEDYVVHASGHATKKQILEMYELLKPKTIIPKRVAGDREISTSSIIFLVSLSLLKCGDTQVIYFIITPPKSLC